MAILGIDYGAKKIGLAKSDHYNRIALPLETLINKSREELLSCLKSICTEYGVKKIVVGVPVSMQHSEKKTFGRQKDLHNEQMQEALRFVSWLKENIDLPVEVEDERLSTKMAHSLRKGLVKGPDDAVAAMLILQSYLDRLDKFN